MKCAKNAIDTHPDIINTACGIWYYPNESGSGKPCKFFARCQTMIKNNIESTDWVKELHKKYLESMEEQHGKQ